MLFAVTLPGSLAVIAATVCGGAPLTLRIVSDAVRQIRHSGYVDAALGRGESGTTILRREILPALAGLAGQRSARRRRRATGSRLGGTASWSASGYGLQTCRPSIGPPNSGSVCTPTEDRPVDRPGCHCCGNPQLRAQYRLLSPTPTTRGVILRRVDIGQLTVRKGQIKSNAAHLLPGGVIADNDNSALSLSWFDGNPQR
jgi:hypothetical protein